MDGAKTASSGRASRLRWEGVAEESAGLLEALEVFIRMIGEEAQQFVVE